MNPSIVPPCSFREPSLAIYGILFLVILSVCSHGQISSDGAISGRVRHARTGAYLEGAVVEVTGTSEKVFTGRDGTFTLSRVAPGVKTVRVFYTGLGAKSEDVDVRPGATTQLNVALTESEIYVLDTFRVSGEREGAAASITRQRNADNLMQIVSMDSYGNVADGNIATFMQKFRARPQPRRQASTSASDCAAPHPSSIPSTWTERRLRPELQVPRVRWAIGRRCSTRFPPNSSRRWR